MRWLAAIALSLCLGLGLAGQIARADDAAESKPWLGVGIEPAYQGIRIIEVVADTPADIAGIKRGDHLRAINGDSVTKPEELISNISKRKIGEQVEVTLTRNGRIVRLTMELSGGLGEQELLQRRLVGKPAPDFSLPLIDGPALGRLAELKGKVVIIEFWSPTCEPCKQSMEALAGFAAQHPNEAVVILVSPYRSASSVKQYIEDSALSGMTFVEERNGARALTSYRSTLRPTVVVLGPDGIVRHTDLGLHTDFPAAVAAANRVLLEGRTR